MYTKPTYKHMHARFSSDIHSLGYAWNHDEKILISSPQQRFLIWNLLNSTEFSYCSDLLIHSLTYMYIVYSQYESTKQKKI